MPKHIEYFDNQNEPVVGCDDKVTPLCYFNTVRLKRGEGYDYQLPDYESAAVLASGVCSIEVDGELFPMSANVTQSGMGVRVRSTCRSMRTLAYDA